MKRGLSVGALLLLALMSACGQPALKSTTTTSPIPSALAAASQTVSVAPVAATAAPQVMTCKLPVVTQNSAGWVTFPGGSYQPDPKASVSLPHGPSGFPLSKSYDKAVERWVPVPRDDISPDGKHYAYADLPPVDSSPVHVVDLPSGISHAFNPGAPPTDSLWMAVDYENEGVYLTSQPNGHPASQLPRLHRDVFAGTALLVLLAAGIGIAAFTRLNRSLKHDPKGKGCLAWHRSSGHR